MSSEKKPAKKLDDDKIKLYQKIMQLCQNLGINYAENQEFVVSFASKLNALFGKNQTFLSIECVEFITINKPKDAAEAYHLLNLFVLSDYMKMIGNQLYNSSYLTPEMMQEYIKISGKTADKYSKGMLTLKAYRGELPAPTINNNKIQNNTLNQINIEKIPPQIDDKKPQNLNNFSENSGAKTAEKIVK